MLTYLYSLIWGVKETNSLCPNSFNSMPSEKFHNFARPEDLISVSPDKNH